MIDILSNITVEELGRVFYFTTRQCKKLKRKLKRLDQNNTWLDTFEEISDFVTKIVNDQLKEGTNIIRNVMGPSSRRICGANGCVFFDASYDNTPVVVKIIKNDNITETFFESILNLILSKEGNKDIGFPRIYRMGLYPVENTYKIAVIQEKLESKSLNSLGEVTLREAMVKLCNGLYDLRNKNGVSFSHRDLHTGNIMYSSEKIYFIDLGYSCVTLPKTCGSIQYETPGGFKLDPAYSCDNEVHDLCHLLLTLRATKQYEWLIKACHDICLLYYKTLKQVDPDPRITYKGYPRNSWKNFKESDPESYFHPWYMYKLYKVDIKKSIYDIRSIILGEVSLLEELGGRWGLKF